MNQRPANHRLVQAVRTICASRAGLTLPAAALLGFNMVSVALAGPTGGIVVGGEATISTPAAGRTVIDQASQHLQVNWNTFDVGANESVRFNQPSSTAVALNRILDQNPSQIFGSIEANGQVILVNPNGMLFGHSAQLNVGSLVASSLDVIGFDAATGRYSFGTSSADVGAIVNDGVITAAPGGSVTLLGGRVTNNGSILANFGTVNLAAGRAATLDLVGDGLLRLEVDGELLTNNAGASAAVENGGVIEANGGQVLLTAQAIDGVFASLVNNTGVVRANRIDNSGGTIRLLGAGGTVRSSGVLDASAGDAVSSGGRVEVLGEQVGLFEEALVDVSGSTSGGTALIGGDYQGKNPDVLNAARAYVSSDATIRADAGNAGDGGRVIVWADEITRFNGSISARGGSSSGDGGFAEVSGKEHLVFRGYTDLSAAHGNRGTLLLDPTDITIDDSDSGAPDFEDDGTYAFADDTGPATIGNAKIVELLGTNNVVLQATNNIVQGAGAIIDASGVEDASGRSLTLEAGGSITLNDAIIMNDGDVTLIADSAAAGTDGGDGVGAITMEDGSSIDAGSGAVSLTAAENIRVTSITAAGGVTVESTDAGITMADGASIDADSAAVSLTAADDIRVASIATSGTVSVTSSGGAIVNDDDGVTLISGGAVTLSGTAIGSLADRIATAATSVSATASNGGIFIAEADALNLTANATNGAVNVRTTNGALTANSVTGNGVTLNTGGAGNGITLNGALNAGAGNVTLTTASGAIALNGTVTTANGNVTLTAGGAGSGITLNNAVNAGTGDVTLTAGTAGNRGAIVAGASNQITADSLTATGSRIGTTTARLNTTVNSLNATSTNGGIFISEANELTLTANATGDAVDVQTADGALTVTSASGAGVTLIAGGDASDITLNGAVNAGAGNVTLTAGSTTNRGAIVAGAGGSVSGAAFTANGSSIGTSGNRLSTSVESLNATTTGGGIYITEAGELTVSADATGGAVDVRTTAGALTVTSASGTGVTLIAGGAGSGITLNGAVNAGSGNVTVTAGSITDRGAIVAGAGGSVSGAAFTANGSSIGTSGNRLSTSVESLNATTTGGGIFITEASGLTLTANATGGAVDVQTTAGALTVTSASGGGVTLIAGGDGSGITLNGTVNANAGNASITAGTPTNRGAIVANVGNQVSANSLTVSGASIGADGASLNTNVSTLNATATNGGIFVTEANDLTLSNVSAVGAGGDVRVTSTTGNIVAGDISATNAVTLTATAGAITDDTSDATVISGSSVSLTAQTNIGTVDNFEADNDADVGSSVDVQTIGALTATVASNTGAINLNISGAPSLVTGAIKLGSGPGRAGEIVLQSAGDLNVAGLASGAIEIGNGNSTSVGLRSGGTLTLPSSGGFTDAAADYLLVRGATDVIDEVAGRSFTFAASNLDFRSGATGGATVLNTTVEELSASVGNNQNLTVNETNSLTIGTLDAGNGNITLTAGGAVTDDGDNDTRIIANNALLTAASLGTQLSALDTQVNTLTATTTSGGVYISEANALALTVNATGGAADVRTTNGSLTVNSASGTGVALGAGGAGNGMTVNGAVNGGSGDVTMTAGGAIALNNTVQTVGGDVAMATTAGAITLNGAITTAGGDVTLTSGGAGNGITLNNAVNAGAGDVTLTAGSAATRGAVVAGVGSQIIGDSLSATGSVIGTDAARLSTAVNTLNATSTNGGIFITEADALNLSANATNGAVDIRTTNGALTATSVTGNGVALTTSGVGNGITVNGAMNAGGGDVTLTTAGGTIALNGTVTTAGGDVAMTAGGAGSGITLNSAVSAGAGNVTMTAGTAASRGAIVAGASNQITAGSLTAMGSRIGTSAARLNTTVNSLNATSTNGGIVVSESNAMTLTANATNGAVDVRTTNGALTATSVTGNGVTLIAGGAGNGITVNGTVNAGAGDVTLTAGTAASRGAIVAGAANQVTANSITATGSRIGTSAARLNTTVNSLNATSTNGGIFVTESNALTLTANAANGAVDVRTTNGALTATAVMGEGVTLTAGGAGSGITVNGAVNAGAGDVTLTAGTAASRGAIVAGAASQITGNSLTATGSAIGTSAARLNTAVNTLNATSTNGGVFITEADALNLTANATNGTVDVRTTNGTLTATSVSGNGVTLAANGTGNGITVNGAVNANSGDVSLTAGGAIVAGASNQITGNALTASGSRIGTGSARLNTTVSSLNATSTNGGIFISEADALTLSASATGGAVDVQTSNGSLNATAVSGDGVVLTAGGAGSGITLNGALDASEGDVALTAGTAASRGAITGATGHSISGGSLTAMASSMGANNARLNTSIDSLDAAATTGGVYISEQNGLTLANVNAASDVDVTAMAGDIAVNNVDAGGNVTLAATAGAIVDDGDDSTRLSANALTLTARSIGAASTLTGTVLDSTGRLDTDVTTLNATATAGGIFIDEADGLQSVSVQASGGAAGDIELLTLAGDLNLQNVSASDTLLLAAGRNLLVTPNASAIRARVAELRAGTTDPTGGLIGTFAEAIDLQLSAGNSLRLFVPQTIDPNDPNRAPATLPSAGVASTLNLFGSQGTLAARAGFNQFQGLGETQFTSPAESLVRNLQNQTGTVQAGLDIDWVSFDADVSLFGTLEPSVCLPGDQRDEESSTPSC